MTATTATPVAEQALSARTVDTYARDWALFTDWCHATGAQVLPADPGHRRRVPRRLPGRGRHPPGPGRRHRPPPRDRRPPEAGGDHRGAVRPRPTHRGTGTAAAVDAALRALPSHGWTRGVFGRRDRCLLVLSQLAGVPYQQLARLTVGDISFVNGTATITSAAGSWTLRPADDGPLLCGPCAVTRWVRALDLVMTRHSNRALTEVLKNAEPVTDTSPHLCRSTRGIDDVTRAVPLLPPIDQWGYPPFPLQQLTPHSLSRRARDLLSGDLGAHREFTPEETEPERPAPVPVVERGVYSREDAQRAWARRRADLADLAGVDDLLNDVDARAKELERRTAAVLAAEQAPQETGRRNP